MMRTNVRGLSWAQNFSPQGQFNQVPPGQIRNQFRQWFTCWGLPDEVRLDNGCLWGGWYDLPTVFALWLTGLSVRAHFNPACTPQDNGVIERCNGLAQRWSEVSKCRGVAELQARVDEVDEIQRQYMPHKQGRSRMQLYTAAKHSGREYSRQWERENWSLDEVETQLETYVAKRRVGSQGRISLYYRQVYVGQGQKGNEVQVQYDRGAKMWVISTASGDLMRAVPAVEIDREKIVTLTMTEQAKAKRRSKIKKRKTAE